MLAGLLLQMGLSTAYNNDKASDAERILGRMKREKANPNPTDWEPSGPTAENIKASTKVENLAVKGSPEDKLLSAVKNGDLKTVETLIAACTSLEARDNENLTALLVAAKKGYTDIACKLIIAGARVSAQDRYGWTPLSHASDNGHAAMVKLLIAHGAAKTQKNLGELLVSAAFKGNNEMVEALLEADNIDSNSLKTAYEFSRNAHMQNAIKNYRNK